MCFTIDPKRRAPRTRVAWKVLRRLSDESLASQHCYNLEQGVHEWHPGKVKVRSRGLTSTDEGDSAHGIYVFLTKEAAEQEALYRRCVRIVEVAVDPADFLHRGAIGEDTQATYHKVRLSRKRPLKVVWCPEKLCMIWVPE